MFFLQAEDGIRGIGVTGVQTCALPTPAGRHRLRAVPGTASSAESASGSETSAVKRVTVYRSVTSTWYGPGFYGNRTACGQRLTTTILGVAHRTLPCGTKVALRAGGRSRSEEHTSELQSRQYLVCRLLLEKKKTAR